MRVPGTECAACRSMPGYRLGFDMTRICEIDEGAEFCHGCLETLGGTIVWSSQWGVEADLEALRAMSNGQLARIGRALWDVAAEGSGVRACWGSFLETLEVDDPQWHNLSRFDRLRLLEVLEQVVPRAPLPRLELPAIASDVVISPWVCPRCGRSWQESLDDQSPCPNCDGAGVDVTRVRFAGVIAEIERVDAAVACVVCGHDVSVHHLPGMTCDHRTRPAAGTEGPRCRCPGFVAPTRAVAELEGSVGR